MVISFVISCLTVVRRKFKRESIEKLFFLKREISKRKTNRKLEDFQIVNIVSLDIEFNYFIIQRHTPDVYF